MVKTAKSASFLERSNGRDKLHGCAHFFTFRSSNSSNIVGASDLHPTVDTMLQFAFRSPLWTLVHARLSPLASSVQSTAVAGRALSPPIWPLTGESTRMIKVSSPAIITWG